MTNHPFRRIDRFGAVRRGALGAGLGAALSLLLIAGCAGNQKWHSMNITGSAPSLAIQAQRAPDGTPVSAADFRNHIVLLYLGYTHCPDACPTTLANFCDILKRMGPDSKAIQLLFVTVDPARDTLKVLGNYAAAFSPQIVGLRCTPDQIAVLARRYRLEYSVTPATKDHPYQVTHSSAMYVFDRSGAARLLVSNLATSRPDLAGVAADLKQLVEQGS